MKQEQILKQQAGGNGFWLSEKEVIGRLKASPGSYGRYAEMNQEWKERFMDFCLRKKTLPLTYDPFFKKIFHPDLHPERLSRLLSAILGTEVRVRGILPAEDSMMDGETLLILDILVELEDGSFADIEIQKSPYAFPAERMSCYASDLVMRQYTRTKGEKGKYFTYRDMKKVYTIVLFEKSIPEFRKIPDAYIHHGETLFDTGLKLEMLQEYFLIVLDVFRKFPYPKNRNEQTAWLSLLATEDVEEAELLVKEYPWLEEIYQETADLRTNPEEVLNMYSEALRILDRNTIRYMIEEQQKEIEEQQKEIKEQQKKIKQQTQELQEKDVMIEEINSNVKQLQDEIGELKQQLARG